MLPTPVRVKQLSHWLQGYDNNKFQYLVKGFSHGFHFGFQGELDKNLPSNLNSALQLPEVTQAKIMKEVAVGRVEGPFDIAPIQNLHISPIGLQPKKVEGEYRLIHHLSYPPELSVNYGIAPECKSVKYQSIDDAISVIKWLGKGCFMAKTDIKSAFRLVPVHPDDHYLLGFKWQGKYYYDKCLPMGCSSSCQIFEEISSALQWVATHKLGMPAVVHVLDDFLFIAPSKTMAYECLQKFLLLCQDIGIPIANEKTEGPAQVMTFLGIELDSVNMQATLPLEKVEKCMKLIEPLLDVNKVKLRDLQCLIGTLNFACSVVRPGRTFLRRLINLTIGVQKPFYHIRLTREVKADLKAWKTFLASFNGKSFFLNDFWGKPECTIATDASTTIGYGLVFGRLWAYGKWESQMSNYHITVLELYPIVLSIHLFAETLSNKVVLFLTDNEALIPIINKGTSKDSNIMKLIRLMVVQCLRSNILVKAKHISGVENTRPDCLSRLQVEKFWSLSKGITTDPQPVPVPAHLKLSVMLGS